MYKREIVNKGHDGGQLNIHQKFDLKGGTMIYLQEAKIYRTLTLT